MKSLYLYILFGFISIVFSSCNSVNTKENIKQIDSLSTVITNVENIITQTQNNSIILYFDSVNTYLDSVTKYLKVMPKAKKQNEFIALFTGLRKDIKDLNKYKYISDIEYDKQQLLKLKQDVIENNISKKIFQKYIEEESSAIIALYNEREKILKESDRLKSNFNKYKPVVIEFIDSLKRVNNN